MRCVTAGMIPSPANRFTLPGLLWLFFTALPLAGCGSNSSDDPAAETARFAVVSDTHLFDGTALGTSSPEFIAESVRENKLLKESVEILSSAIARISSSPVGFVLVTGDLSKDGERINHELMAARLAELEAGGKKVFVIPGNHDISNPRAFSYATSPPSPVARVTPAEFEGIYAEFGYREAISRDPNSLSYIAEPVSGIWLFALDSCRYGNDQNQEFPTTSGGLGMATRSWILDRLVDARAQGKVVIGMVHHGILEHLAGESITSPGYVIDNWREVASEFAGHGLNVVFTGHFHANDVTAKAFNGSLLYDIETGSLVTYPNAFRIAEYNFKSRELSIQSERVTGTVTHPVDFENYSQKASKNNLKENTRSLLSAPPFSLREPELSAVSLLLVAGLMAHYAGNETPSLITSTSYLALADSADPLIRGFGQTLASLWTDLPPLDGSIGISLAR